jgi:hypothetical protein
MDEEHNQKGARQRWVKNMKEIYTLKPEEGESVQPRPVLTVELLHNYPRTKPSEAKKPEHSSPKHLQGIPRSLQVSNSHTTSRLSNDSANPRLETEHIKVGFWAPPYPAVKRSYESVWLKSFILGTPQEQLIA